MERSDSFAPLSTGEAHPEFWVQFWDPSTRETWACWRDPSVGCWRGLGHMSYTERLWELGLLTLDFGRLRGAPINVQVPKGYLKKTERGTTSSEQGGKKQWTQTEIQEILKAVEKLFFFFFFKWVQVTQRGCGVSTPSNTQSPAWEPCMRRVLEYSVSRGPLQPHWLCETIREKCSRHTAWLLVSPVDWFH